MSPNNLNLNLDLPQSDPGLIQHYKDGTYDQATFAIYTLVPGMTASQLQAIADKIQAPFTREQMGNGHVDVSSSSEPSKLIRLATPTALFAGKTLVDIVEAQVAMDKEVKEVIKHDDVDEEDDEREADDDVDEKDGEGEKEDEENSSGNRSDTGEGGWGRAKFTLGVHPNVFLVVTSPFLTDTHSLLLVYSSFPNPFPNSPGLNFEINPNVKPSPPPSPSPFSSSKSESDGKKQAQKQKEKFGKYFVEPRFAHIVLASHLYGNEKVDERTESFDVDSSGYDAGVWEEQFEEHLKWFHEA